VLIFAIAACVFGVLVAVAHSIIGERRVLGPLFRESTTGMLSSPPMRNLTRAMFQLHTLVWAGLGIAVLINRLQGGGDVVVYLAIIIFTVSGVGNLAALRQPHPGGILLLLAAASSAADLWFS